MDILIHPAVPPPRPRGTLPSCLRGSWGCGAARASTTTCGCGVRLYDIKNMIGMVPSDAPHPQGPRRHDGRAPSARGAGTAGWIKITTGLSPRRLLKMHATIYWAHLRDEISSNPGVFSMCKCMCSSYEGQTVKCNS